MSLRIKLLLQRRSAYRAAFLDEHGELTDAGALVLTDLARYVGAQTSTAWFSPVTRTLDTHATMLAEGRRQVFNRITQYLNVSESKIYALMEREHGTN